MDMATESGGCAMKRGVDEKCAELAEHFLRDIGWTPQREQELSEAIQTVCEDFCREMEQQRDRKG
jgi:hypothetical protein